MLYNIYIFHRYLSCNANDVHVADLVPDSYSIGTDNFVMKESVFSVFGSNEEFLVSGRV